MIKNYIKSFAKKQGYIISKYDPKRDPAEIKKSFLVRNNINVVLDVGANRGQFALQLRNSGYNAKIVSFEPLSSAFNRLQQASQSDRNWDVLQCALGNKVGSAEINVSGNSYSSSILTMKEAHAEAAPDSIYIDKEVITINTLDSVYGKYVTKDDKVFLKIDTQGYTKNVLEGANLVIDDILGVLVEMSLVELYSGEPLIGEVTSMLYEKGFNLLCIEPEFVDKKSGRLLQVNGLFGRD